MSEQKPPKSISLKSALTPGQPALSPETLQKLLLLLPVISLLVSIGIVNHQYMRRNSLRAQIKQSIAELNTLEMREKELMGGKFKSEPLDDDHDHTESP